MFCVSLKDAPGLAEKLHQRTSRKIDAKRPCQDKENPEALEGLPQLAAIFERPAWRAVRDRVLVA
jgi:hypothetical protein